MKKATTFSPQNNLEQYFPAHNKTLDQGSGD